MAKIVARQTQTVRRSAVFVVARLVHLRPDDVIGFWTKLRKHDFSAMRSSGVRLLVCHASALVMSRERSHSRAQDGGQRDVPLASPFLLVAKPPFCDDAVDMTQEPDHNVNALVEAARRGNRSAFDSLVATSHKALIGFVRGHMPADLVEPETVAQKVWVAVWKDIQTPPEEGGFDPGKGSFQAFVRYRHALYILRREIAAKAKLRGRERSLEQLEEEGGTLGEPEDSAPPSSALSLENEEYLRLRLAAFREMFRILFLCGGYPHQQLALAFSKYLYGQHGDRVQRVHKQHGATHLDQLVRDFVSGCHMVSEMPGEAGLGKLENHLSPLLLRLPLKVGKLMEMDKASREHFGKLGRRLAGDTCLADYYAERKGGFTTAIPDWCYKVEKRVRHMLGVSDDRPMEEALEQAAEMQEGTRSPACARCKLRHLPPCASASSSEGAGVAARNRMAART